jgi:hypothetical protein
MGGKGEAITSAQMSTFRMERKQKFAGIPENSNNSEWLSR